MRFDTVGPYSLNRADLFFAAITISFYLGSRKVRLWAIAWIALASAFGLWGVVRGDWWQLWAAIIWLSYIFIICPMMRPLKNSKSILLDYDIEGIAAETSKARTIYKWSTIGRTCIAFRRLFIMVDSGMAIVLSERFADRGHLEQIKCVVDDHVAGNFDINAK